MPVAVPPIASTTTAYCVSFARPSTSRGSMRSDCFGVIGTSFDAASEPSANLYQEICRLVAVTLWSTRGGDQPALPPRGPVTVGRDKRVAGRVLAGEAGAGVCPITFTTARDLP